MLNDEEDAALESMALTCGMSKSQYLRYLITGIKPKVIPAVNDDTHYQLMKIGTNLNQIARRLNSGNSVPYSDVTDAIISLRGIIASIRKEITGECKI